eukprot:7189550-Prymnesium_polylepis.2
MCHCGLLSHPIHAAPNLGALLSSLRSEYVPAPNLARHACNYVTPLACAPFLRCVDPRVLWPGSLGRGPSGRGHPVYLRDDRDYRGGPEVLRDLKQNHSNA